MSARETILIELYWHNERLHTFVVRPTDAAPQVFSMPLSRQRLTEYVSSFQLAFTRNNADERESGAWSDLSGMWLEEQLGKLINGNGRIVFVPHGAFHHFPLHLLSFNGNPLVMTCPVSYSPSATLLVECRRRSRAVLESHQEARFLTIGVDFEEEARMVHAIAKGTDLLLDSQKHIEKRELLSRLKDFRWVHFSCHGIFDVEQPMQSGLVLSPTNGKGLTLDEVRNLPSYLPAADIARSGMNAALVTLSACETAQTKDLPGDEILGLTRSFFLAGAAAVMVSFWPVPAKPTQIFMENFYRQLVAESISLSDAVRTACIETAKLHPDPFDWGAFTVIGDGLSTWKLN